jgi:hypothetical protein
MATLIWSESVGVPAELYVTILTTELVDAPKYAQLPALLDVVHCVEYKASDMAVVRLIE